MGFKYQLEPEKPDSIRIIAAVLFVTFEVGSAEVKVKILDILDTGFVARKDSKPWDYYSAAGFYCQ
jgi:hypothetical protein